MEPKDILKKTIAGTAIAITLALGGATGEYYLDKDIKLAEGMYTGYEYSQIKPALIKKVKINKAVDKKSTSTMELKEQQMWVDMINIEIEKCGEAEIFDVTEENIVNKLNSYVEECNK